MQRFPQIVSLPHLWHYFKEKSQQFAHYLCIIVYHVVLQPSTSKLLYPYIRKWYDSNALKYRMS